MKTTISFITLLSLFSTSGSDAQITPWFNHKRAEKKVRLIKLTIEDSAGNAVSDQDVTLECAPPPGSHDAPFTLTETTGARGIVKFRRAVPQSTNCKLYRTAIIKAKKKGEVDQPKQVLVRQLSFSEFEPTTTAYVALRTKISADEARPLVGNQKLNQMDNTHEIDVYLYKKDKRIKGWFKQVSISCMTNTGKVFDFAASKDKKKRKETVRKTFLFASKAKFDEIPYGSECIIMAPACPGQPPQPRGFVRFDEQEHTVIDKIRFHIDLPNCDDGKGGGGGGGNGSNPNSSLTSSENSTLEESEADEDSDDDAHSSSVEASASPAPTAEPYRLTVIEQAHDSFPEKKLSDMEITLVNSVTHDVIATKTNEHGEVVFESTAIQPGVSYFVSLGSESNPIATRNIVSAVQFEEGSRSQIAPFNIGAVRVNFTEDSYNRDLIESKMQDLDDIVKVMNHYPKLSVTLEGYTNSHGEAAYNLTLSQNRAEAIKKYLVEKGIDIARITVKYFGEDPNFLIMKDDANGNEVEDFDASRRTEIKPDWDSTLQH